MSAAEEILRNVQQAMQQSRSMNDLHTYALKGSSEVMDFFYGNGGYHPNDPVLDRPLVDQQLDAPAVEQSVEQEMEVEL